MNTPSAAAGAHDGTAGGSDLAPLRQRLAGATAREAVLVDFLEDELREAEAAVAELSEWLAAVAAAVSSQRATRQDLVALAARSPGAGEAEYVGGLVASVRRRLALVAVGLARAGE